MFQDVKSRGTSLQKITLSSRLSLGSSFVLISTQLATTLPNIKGDLTLDCAYFPCRQSK